MKLKTLFSSRVLMSVTALFLFVHFTAILTLLMIRVLRLEDMYFVSSLEAVGGFFRDSSLAAFLVTLMRHNFPREALRSLQAAAESRQNTSQGGYYPPGGGYPAPHQDHHGHGASNEHPWDDLDYGDRVASF
jgi:hypothetical protein